MDEYVNKPKFKMSEEELSRFWQILDTNFWPVENAVIFDLLLADSKEAFEAGGNRAMQFLFGIREIEQLQSALESAKELLKKQSGGPRLVVSNPREKR